MSLGRLVGTRTNLAPRDISAWVSAFVVLAVAMPLDNAIGANPFFLRSHGVSGWGYLALQIAGTALAWLILWGLLALLKRLVSATVFDVLASVATLAVAWFCATNGLGAEPHIASALSGLPPWGWWVIGLILAALLTQLARKVSAGTIVLVFLTIASLIPIITATLGSASSNVDASVEWNTSGDRPSVLWIIADEMNAHAVIDAEGKVHPSLTNMSELQEQATTYTHTYGLSNKTERAIPAMMGGLSDIGAQDDATMNALSESMGLVGTLSDEYDVTFSSSIFAPPAGVGECNNDGQSWRDKANSFGADLAAVAGNTALISPLRDAFPSTEAKWRDFWEQTSPGWMAVARGRLECQANSDEPFFAVWHTLTTHNPYVYGRDGQPMVLDPQHTLAVIDPGMNTRGEVTNSSVYEFQRRLYANSVANFDRRLGQVLSVLKATGRYDDTMIIVTADHGVALTEARRDGSGGEDERRVGADPEQMWGEIAQVPLIVKYPGETTPQVVTAPRTSSQIMPTVLDVMGAKATLPWPMQPPLDQDPSAITFTLRHLGAWTSIPYAGAGRHDEWTPEQVLPDPEYPFAIGVAPDLLGAPVPAGASQVPVSVTIAPTMSSQQLFQFRTSKRCAADTSLLSANRGSGEVVVGSVVWESSDGPATRGWAILPTSFGTDVTVWCAP